jgi:hypothetical protein
LFPKVKYNETATHTTPLIIKTCGMFTIANKTNVFQLESKSLVPTHDLDSTPVG